MIHLCLLKINKTAFAGINESWHYFGTKKDTHNISTAQNEGRKSNFKYLYVLS